MIRLHSGVPGTGKSLKIVDTLAHEKEYIGRNIYSHAIEGWEAAVMLYCHHPACRVCRHFTAEEKQTMNAVEEWFNWVQPGDLLVIDEAHYPFPSRREKEQPLYIQRLTEHRHDGIDFWLATPNANFLDINVRRLVQQHKHFVIGITGRWTFSHTEVMESDDKLKFGVKERFFLPKRSFGLYKSADAHVKLKTKIPSFVWKFGILGIVGASSIAFALTQVQTLRRSNEDETEEVVQEVSTTEDSIASSAVLEDVMRRESSRVESSDSPTLLGCVSNEKTCSCYDTDAVKVRMSVFSCRAISTGDLNANSVHLR